MTTQQLLTSAWDWSPAVIALCAVTLAAHAWLSHFRLTGRSFFLLAAVAVFFLALESPIATLADGYLFSAHMLQHLLLQLAVPPLLLLSLPRGEISNPEGPRPWNGETSNIQHPTSSIQWGSQGFGIGSRLSSHFGFRISAFFRPSAFRLRVSQGPSPEAFAPPPRWLTPLSAILRRPLLTWCLGLGAMWLWHVPSLCSASATEPWVHVLQGISLLLMGAAFWWPIIGPWCNQWLPPLPGVLYLFSACVGCTILGIVITFAPLSVCPAFMHPADRLGILPLLRDGWGLNPSRDQQLGGLLMWVPPCFVYLCGIFGLLARWYAGPDPELAVEAGCVVGDV